MSWDPNQHTQSGAPLKCAGFQGLEGKAFSARKRREQQADSDLAFLYDQLKQSISLSQP